MLKKLFYDNASTKGPHWQETHTFYLTGPLRVHIWNLFSYFSPKTYVVGTQKNRLTWKGGIWIPVFSLTVVMLNNFMFTPLSNFYSSCKHVFLEWKTVWILIRCFNRSHLIWIYSDCVFKRRINPGSAGQIFMVIGIRPLIADCTVIFCIFFLFS